MPLQEDVWQGQYGEDLVRAMASAAGLLIGTRSPDVDGVDFNFRYPGRLNGRGYASIEAQVKSWKQPRIIDDKLAYPLKSRNYNNLVGTPPIDFPVARLLFLVIVPEEPADYVDICGEHYSFAHAAYWLSLMDFDRAPESSTAKTVYVPTSNLLTPDSLLTLVGRDFIAEAA